MAFKVAIVGGEGTEDYAFYEQKCIKKYLHISTKR